jgi:hypothetical protein
MLWVAACCTVLRSRWCQSGVRRPCITRCRLLYKPDARIRYFRRAMSEYGLGRATLYRASSLLAAPATCTTVTASIFINMEQRGSNSCSYRLARLCQYRAHLTCYS